jgi:tellurite resistance protein
MVFLIIFGTRGVTTTEARGEFHCPSCERKRPYEHKRVRRFFTLYFIPIIPLDTLGEYVECQRCRDTFAPAVLSFDPEAEERKVEAEFRAAVKRVMVMMMLADGEIAGDEVETIRTIYGKIAKTEISKDDVDREVAAARDDARSLKQYVASTIGTLNDAGKEVVVKAAFFVAAADGKITDEETTLLAELAGALEMSPSHFKGVVDELLAA